MEYTGVMVTVKHIAQQAGVSVGTVSNVMNNRPGVTVETSEKVLEAMKVLGYQLNARRRPYQDPGIRTGVIGLLCVGLPLEAMQLPFFVKFISCLESVLASRNLHMILAQVPDRPVLPEHLCARRLDGAFMLGYPGAKLVPALQRLRTVGVFGRPRPGFDWVTTDASEHGRLAGEYLLGRGHQRLAFLNPDRAHDVFAEFGQSFQETVAAHGVEASMLVAQKDYGNGSLWTQQRYREAVEELLQGYFSLPAQERPTGMYVANDEITLATYQVLAEHGVQAGVDLEIISNDNDEPFLAGLTPRPATIEPDYEEIAQRAVQKVLYRIKRPGASVGAKLLIPPRLASSNGEAKGARYAGSMPAHNLEPRNRASQQSAPPLA